MAEFPDPDTAAARTPGLAAGRAPGHLTPPQGREGSPEQYWERRLSERRGLDGVGYFNFGLPFNRWLYFVRRRIFTRNLQALDIDLGRASVLDVGSGTGFWLDVWNALGVRSMASLDFTQVSVEHLKREYPGVRVERADISSPDVLKLFGGRFDVISAFDVLFHILSDEGYRQALVNVSHLLKPGGYFIFSDFFLHRDARRSSTEVDRPLEKIEADLGACGLKPVLRVPMSVLMNSPVDMHFPGALMAWRFSMAPVRFVPFLGWLYGAVLAPIDLLLTRIFLEGPTTEMMICRKT